MVYLKLILFFFPFFFPDRIETIVDWVFMSFLFPLEAQSQYSILKLILGLYRFRVTYLIGIIYCDTDN